MTSFKVCGFHVKLDQAAAVYEKIYSLTSKINKKYCDLNGYDYQFDILDKSVLTDFVDTSIFRFSSGWHWSCIYKYQYLLEMLEKSSEDYVVYVEYDACFCNDFLRLENYVDDNHDIFCSRCNWSYDIDFWIKNLNTLINELNSKRNDLFNYDRCTDAFLSKDIASRLTFTHNVFFCNEGFFILKNSELAKKFLKAIVKYAPLFYDNTDLMCTESQTLQCIMSKDVFYPHVKILPPKTQGHIYGWSNQYNEDECLICHNSSIDKDTLYQFLQTIAGNKYWGKYKILSTD
ncbi:MAG: hypothetical protein J6Y54_07200 [Lentisphaeria bacterium]|nr:hypothetical protein [Lentisphaeria bacterium]